MEETKLAEILELKTKSLEELKAKYQEVFGQEPATNNKVFLWRKIAYRMQEIEHGGVFVETQGKIQELIIKYDPVNNKSLRPDNASDNQAKNARLSRDKRLPIPGTVVTKEYKGIMLQVKILERGFEYNGKVYKSLTAIAKEVTGAHWNGFLFFRI